MKKLLKLLTVVVFLVLPIVGCTYSDRITGPSYFESIYIGDTSLSPIGPYIDNYYLELDDFNDWGKTLVGSGNTNDSPTRVAMLTGIVANSSSLRYCQVAPVMYGDSPDRLDWDKKCIFIFSLVRINTDAEFVGRIQVKNGTVIGQLVDDGFGLQIDNYTLTGETFGTGGRGTVALVTTMVNFNCLGVMIVHTPGVKDEFFLNSGAGWVLEGVISNTTLIPSGLCAGSACIVTSGSNGVTGGVNGELDVYKLYLFSYR